MGKEVEIFRYMMYQYFEKWLVFEMRRFRYELQKPNREVNSVTKHKYNCMLDDGIYKQVNNYMFRPIAAICRLLQFCSKSVIYIYIYIYISILRGDVGDIYIYIHIYMTLFEQNCNNLKMAAKGRNM